MPQMNSNTMTHTIHQPADDMFWIGRLNPTTGSYRSYNARTRQVIEDDGAKADAVAWKRDTIISIASVLRGGLFGLRMLWDDTR